MIFLGVSSRFQQIAFTIKQFVDLDIMIVEEVVGRLNAHKERIWGHEEPYENMLLLTH